MYWFSVLSLLLVFFAGGEASAQCTGGYPFQADCPLSAAGLNAALTPIHVPDNTALQAASVAAYGSVVRDDFCFGCGAPPLQYKGSNFACTLNAGAGDGGSQVQSADGKCWLANFPPGGFDARWWGQSTGPITFNVNKTAGTDQGGAAFCFGTGGLSCKTWGQALKQALRFDVAGGNILIKNVDGSAPTYNESIMVNSQPYGAGNRTNLPNIGIVWQAGMVVFDLGGSTLAGQGAGALYSLGCSNFAAIGLRNGTITGIAVAGQGELFAQIGCTINVFDGVTFGASNFDKAHSENFGNITFWQNWTDTGNAVIDWNTGNLGTIIQGGGVGTYVGTPSFSNAVIVGAGGSSVQFNGPGYPFTGPAAGRRFDFSGNSSLITDGTFNASAMAGSTLGVVRSGGTAIIGQNTCIGNAGACPPAAPTGLGGGSAALSSGSTVAQGQIILRCGTTCATNGIVHVSSDLLPYDPSATVFSKCAANLGSAGTGAWAAGSLVEVQLIGSTPWDLQLIWENGATPGALANGSTYAITYKC